MASSTSMYFQASEEDLEALSTLPPFTKQLVSCLIHTYRQGVYLANTHRQDPIDTSSTAGATCQKYITKALKNDLAADKLFALRRTGQFIKFVVQHLPLNPPMTATGIFQLCVWRTFAFGHREHMTESMLPLNSKTPDPDALPEIIVTQGGPLQILVQAYGNFQVRKIRVLEILKKFWLFAAVIKEKNKAPSFSDVHRMICEHDIPAVRQGGIVSWLLSRDLAEFGICSAPTSTDLAKHMLQGKSKPAGPTKGLEVAEKMAGEKAPLDCIKSLAQVFQEVMGVFGDSAQNLQVVSDLVADCERLQGRRFSVADLEHGFCKIARADSLMGNAGKLSKPKAKRQKI